MTSQNPTAATAPAATSFGQLRGWQPIFSSELALAKGPPQLRHMAVLVKPTSVVEGLGAKVLLTGHPSPNSRWRFKCWVKASNLSASRLLIQLRALKSNARDWVVIAAAREPSRAGWHQFSITGKVKLSGAIALQAVVSTQTSVTLASRLALDGVSATLISTSRS